MKPLEPVWIEGRMRESEGEYSKVGWKYANFGPKLLYSSFSSSLNPNRPLIFSFSKTYLDGLEVRTCEKYKISKSSYRRVDFP